MVGDVVLFLKNDSVLNSTYQYGLVNELFPGKDSKIRQVKVQYRNHNEKAFRTTMRAVRELVVIHGADEQAITTELHEIYNKTK